MPEPAGPATPSPEGSAPASEPQTAPHRTFVDLSPLRASPVFARLWIGQSIAGIGAFLTATAVGLHIYDITGDTFLVALVAGIALLPMIVAGLWGGMLVDAFDRRTVAILAAIVSWLSTATILGLAIWDVVAQQHGERAAIWPFYIATTANSVAATIAMSARSAAIPRILPPDMVSRAAALNGIVFGMQLAVGPALGGILIASVGYPITYAIDLVLFCAGFVGVFGLPRLPPVGEVRRPGLRSLVEGFRFLGTAPNIRTSFLADIIAMGLGRPFVLFPALAAGAIGGGATTAGILTAAMAVGTFLTGLFSGPVARVRRHGIAIGRAIMAFGAFTVLFGIVVIAAELGWFGPTGPDQVSWPALILAFVCLAGTGASDEVSAIFRSTMMLIAAPDEMRGRMQGIFSVVVAGGPRLGDLLAGTVATAFVAVTPQLGGEWAPPIIGGVLIIVLISVLVRVSPGFRAYDVRHPTP